MSDNKSVKTIIHLKGQKVSLYAGRSVAEAFQAIAKDLNLYAGVRLTQFLEVLYEQGKKDGAHEVFGQVDDLKAKISHQNPGRPKKKKKPAKKK
jgi:hypothetical protein